MPFHELAPPLSRSPEKTWRVGTLTYSAGGITILFFWLLFGDFAWSMRDRSIGPTTQWYLSSLKVSNLVFGSILYSFPAVLSLILGPIVSVKSDRHRGRWGRRIPFLLFATPLAAAGMVGIGISPLVASRIHSYFPAQDETLVALVCFGVFWSIFEFASLLSQNVFGGLINDVVPKELLGRFFGLFRAVSLIDGMIFNYWVLGSIPVHFSLIVILIGISYGLAFMLVCFKVKEGKYPAPPPDADNSRSVLGNYRSEAADYLRVCFGKRYYIAIFFMWVLAYVSFMPVNIFSLPYAKSLAINMDTYGKYLALTYLVSLCLSYFLGWLVDLYHPMRIAIVALFGYFLVSSFGFFFARSPETFLTAWVMHGVLSGCYLTAAASLTQRLFPHERFAQYASAAGIMLALASMSIPPAMGRIIDLSGNNYRYTFGAGCVLAVGALILFIYVYRRFVRYGGVGGYVAP